MRKESQPMWITNVFVDSPCKVICSFYLVLLLSAIITVFASYMIPSLSGARGRDFAIVDSSIQLENDLYYLANDYLVATKGDRIAPLQSEVTGSIFLLYSA